MCSFLHILLINESRTVLIIELASFRGVKMLNNIQIQGITDLLTNKLIGWYESGIKIIPNLIIAIIVFIVFLIISRIIKNIASKLLPKITKNIAVIDLLKSIFTFSVNLLGLFIALEIMNLEKTVTSILAGAGVLGLALGFAFQEIASNFVSGILIAFREPYKLGDIVEVDNYFGEVTKINLRTTSIMTFQGLETLIPNKYMFTKPFINFTTTPRRRLDISIGVSYSDDLEKVEDVTKKALMDIEQRIQNEEIEIFFEEFGSSSINLQARVWIHYPGNQDYLKAQHTAIIAIKKAYDKNDITIPFPIRTLDFAKPVEVKSNNN
jgi:small conductance mechanosensitive channel